MHTEIPKPPRVISYARYSSRRQGHGISLERQTARARAYCEERGWSLDDELRYKYEDLGKSGFSGANRETGALGQLLADLQRGEIERGSCLLIEAFDRLTREDLPAAVMLLLDLLQGGLVIVTLADRRVWQSGMDTTDFMFSVMLLSRGHEESKRRSDLSKANFRRARELGDQRTFGTAPGWLIRKDGSEDGVWWVVDEEKAESVRKVFEACSDGLGSKAIAARANREAWRIPTRTTSASTAHWHAQMPQIILRNRSVLGEHEHWDMSLDARRRAAVAGASSAWRGEPTGIRSDSYYPRIVSDDLWRRAHAAIDARRAAPPKKSQQFWNIWSGVMRCGWCGAAMQRKIERKGHLRAQLVCSAQLARACTCEHSPNGSAKLTDAPLLYHVCMEGGRLMGLGPNRAKLIKELDAARGELAALKQSESNMILIVSDVGYSPELSKKMRENRDAQERCGEAISRLERELDQVDAGDSGALFGDMKYAARIEQVLYEAGEIEAEERAVFNRRLLRAVHAIWLFAYDCAVVQFRSGALTLVGLEPKVPGRSRPKLREFELLQARGVPPDLVAMVLGGWARKPLPEWVGVG